VDLEV